MMLLSVTASAAMSVRRADAACAPTSLALGVDHAYTPAPELCSQPAASASAEKVPSFAL